MAALTTCVGCAPEHSIPKPRTADKPPAVEVGEIRDQNGLDVSPVIAQRLEDHGLAEPHLVEEPTGSRPFVSGRVKAEPHPEGSYDPGMPGLLKVMSFGLGLGALVAGAVLLIIGEAQGGGGADDPDAQGANQISSAGMWTMVGGAPVFLFGMITMMTVPDGHHRYMIDANLEWQARGQASAQRIDLLDEVSISAEYLWWERGLMIWDGIAYGIAARAQGNGGVAAPLSYSSNGPRFDVALAPLNIAPLEI